MKDFVNWFCTIAKVIITAGKDVANWAYALIGVLLAIGSAFNEGAVFGAWAGVLYAIVFGIIMGFGEKLMRGIPWKDYGWRIIFCIFGAIIAALIIAFF
jgi:hypothetical protein